MNPLSLSDDERHHSLLGTHPDARPHFEALLSEVKRRGWWPYISSAVRTFGEQKGLHDAKQSRTDCGWHQFGRAIDLDIDGNVTDPTKYRELAEWWKARGPQFVWGGDFEGYGPHGDFVHFQYAPTKVPGPLLCEDRSPEAFARYWSGTEPEGDAAPLAIGAFFALWLLKLKVASRGKRRGR